MNASQFEERNTIVLNLPLQIRSKAVWTARKGGRMDGEQRGRPLFGTNVGG
jgi:hypothetical protein